VKSQAKLVPKPFEEKGGPRGKSSFVKGRNLEKKGGEPRNLSRGTECPIRKTQRLRSEKPLVGGVLSWTGGGLNIKKALYR